jgi:hypothetical protein
MLQRVHRRAFGSRATVTRHPVDQAEIALAVERQQRLRSQDFGSRILPTVNSCDMLFLFPSVALHRIYSCGCASASYSAIVIVFVRRAQNLGDFWPPFTLQTRLHVHGTT